MIRNGQLWLDRRTVGVVGLALLWSNRTSADADDATTLMAASHDINRFAAARFRATLHIEARSGRTQTRDFAGVAKLLDDGSASARLIRFASPADMRGVATLTIERRARADDLWIYLPAFRKVRRLVSSNRADPWVGSDFSLGDITGHKVEDWRHQLAGSATVDGVDCWIIDSRPLNPRIAADTGYSRRLSWLRKPDAAMMRGEFFDFAGGLSKRVQADDLRVIESSPRKVQPMRLSMTTLASGSRSTMAFSSFRVADAVAEAELQPTALPS
jgi:hypothetical protein